MRDGFDCMWALGLEECGLKLIVWGSHQGGRVMRWLVERLGCDVGWLG